MPRISTVISMGIAVALGGGCADNLTPPPAAGDDTAHDCLPDLDNRIDAEEMPVILSGAADYYVSPAGRSVDVAGTVDDRGVRVWDMAAEQPDDERLPLAAAPLDGQWYADAFPGGRFVLAAEVDGGLDGIYSKDERGLWLHGLASTEAEPSAQRTLLAYDAPVAVLRFPLRPGDAWTDEGEVRDGVLAGLPYNGTDTYEVAVDGSGELHLPYVTFEQAHRVRTHVVVAPAAGGETTSQRQVSFLFECFGEVARVTSRPDEAAEDFTTAAEVRRWAL